MRSLDTIAALKPAVVVAGHKTPERKDDPSCLEFSKAYLRFYDEALAASKTAETFKAKRKDRYPDLGLEGVLQMAPTRRSQRPGRPCNHPEGRVWWGC